MERCKKPTHSPVQNSTRPFKKKKIMMIIIIIIIKKMGKRQRRSEKQKKKKLELVGCLQRSLMRITFDSLCKSKLFGWVYSFFGWNQYEMSHSRNIVHDRVCTLTEQNKQRFRWLSLMHADDSLCSLRRNKINENMFSERSYQNVIICN